MSEPVVPEAAGSGFSNPTVITMRAMCILSEGQRRTGVPDVIARSVKRVAGWLPRR